MNREKIIKLYDIYYELLTNKQQKYFEQYYYEDLSYSEIAENFSVSRTAVYDQIKKVCANLEKYENTLKVANKEKQIKDALKIEDVKTLKNRIIEIIEE